MKNIELLPVADEVRKAIERTNANYRRHLQICTDILEVQGNVITVRVEQFKRLTDKVYDRHELIAKAKEVLSHLPDGEFTFHWRPLLWEGEGIQAVSPEWVKRNLKKNGMTQQQLAEAMEVDKHVLSKLLGGTYGMTNWAKAAFYWYFKGR